jgi:hypothetical protein
MAPLVMQAVEHDLDRLGGSAMMTEGLACGGVNISDYDECNAVMKQLDQHLYSWTDYGDSQGRAWGPSALQQQVWARTYARAVAGTPVRMSYAEASVKREFEFCYELDSTIRAPTEVFASATYTYPEGGPVVRTTSNIKGALAPGSADVWLFLPTVGGAAPAGSGAGPTLYDQDGIASSADSTDGADDGKLACVWMEKK